MNNNLKKLTVITPLLFILSIVVYYYDTRKVSGIVEGSYFITGLDTSKIVSVEISQQNNTQISFLKEGNEFLLSSHKSYPADTKRINNLLFKISNIRALEKSSSSVSDQMDYKVSDKQYGIKVVLKDKSDLPVVEFFVGKTFKNKGNYVRLAGSNDIYLSKEPIGFSTTNTSYLDRKLLNLETKQIKTVDYQGRDKFKVVRDEQTKSFVLDGMTPDKIKSEILENDLSRLSLIKFNDYLRADDPKVANLKYSINFKVSMNDTNNYNISFAKDKDDYYIKVASFIENMPNQIQLSKTDNEEKLKSVEDMINAKTKSSTFNLKHGQWIYVIKKALYESFQYPISKYKK